MVEEMQRISGSDYETIDERALDAGDWDSRADASEPLDAQGTTKEQSGIESGRYLSRTVSSFLSAADS